MAYEMLYVYIYISTNKNHKKKKIVSTWDTFFFSRHIEIHYFLLVQDH